ncbi:MAG TPA: hypothetical protein VED63_03065, partial [Acidimicrobiales bacterium]|nr:hypothetical protein [Acidimicrobiales bacterium]
WISLRESDGPYPLLEEGLTTSAALAQIVIFPVSTSPTISAHGVRLFVVTGQIPHGQVTTGSARLDFMARSKLPARYSARGSNDGQPWSTTITFSHWGETSSVDAPTGALPFSSLQGSAPEPRTTPAV